MRPRALFQGRGLLAIAAAALDIEFVAPDLARPYAIENGVACITIEGPLTQKPGLIWDNYESIRSRAVQAFADPKIHAVLLDINSPGGDVAGCFELAAELRGMASASTKRLVAFTDGMAASAAYAIASAAPGGVFVTQTAQVGSIGVINTLVDVTALDRAQGVRFSVISSGERKKDGNPHVAITDDAESNLLATVNGVASIFFAWVNRTRGIDASKIQSFDGALFFGTNAVKVGLANGVTTKSDLLASLARAPSASAAGTSEATMADEEDKKDPPKEAPPKSYADEMRAKLEEDAKSDDESKASAAKKMLAALDDGDGDERPAKDDEKPKGEDEKPSASALAMMASRITALEADNVAIKAAHEGKIRTDLLAGREISASTAKEISHLDLKTFRAVIETFPKKTPRNLAAAEQPSVDASIPRGAEDPNAPRAPRLSPEMSAKLAERMGLKAVSDGGIKKDRNFVTLGIVPRKKDQKPTAPTAPGKVA